MSKITLPTKSLVGLLVDVILTAGCDPEISLLRSVLLDTARGDVLTQEPGGDGEEPLIDSMESDLLVGLSTNATSMISQVHTACVGSLPRPVLISSVDADVIVKAFKTRRK